MSKGNATSYHRIGKKILGDLAVPAGTWANSGILHSYASTPGAYDLNVGGRSPRSPRSSRSPGQNFVYAFSKRQECIYLLGADFEIN